MPIRYCQLRLDPQTSRRSAAAQPHHVARMVARAAAQRRIEEEEGAMRTHRHLGRRTRAAVVSAWLVGAFAIGSPVAAASPSTVYVSLGDSLAWGDGASAPDETGYTALLADYFAGTQHGAAKAWTNLAVRGETTETFLAGQVGATFAAIGDPATDTRVVTLALGGNDVGALLNDPSDSCVQNPMDPACRDQIVGALQGAAQRYPVVLGSIAGALEADPGGASVYVMTVYNPFGGLGAPYEDAVDGVLLGNDLRIDCSAIDPAAFGLNDIIACTARAFGMIVVDAHPVIGDAAIALTHIGEGTFDTHPTDGGHALLAKAHRGIAP
jgi:lysophospholipase L1-like esterase